MNQVELIATDSAHGKAVGDCPVCKHNPPNHKSWQERDWKGPALCYHPDQVINSFRFDGPCPGYEPLVGNAA